MTPQEIQELRNLVRISKKSTETKRAQAVILLDRMADIEDIGILTDLSRSQIFNVRKRFLAQGITALIDKREGKPKELLTKKQRHAIIETVKTKTPKDCGYVSEHWTTGILGNWIEQEYQTKYKSKTSLYLVFRQARFTYHKPGMVYREHDEQEIEQWKKEAKPKLKRLLKEDDTIILAEDEMILTTRTTIQKVWLPQGEYPKIECSTGGRKRRSVYGFLNMKTGDEHAFKTEKQNMYVTREILEQVRIIYPKQKIALLWDNAGWHKGSIVQEYIKADGNIKIIHFPRYAPEENPQEHVWKSGRSAITHNRFIQDIDEATDDLVEYFNKTKFRYSLLGLSPIS
ncbi:MAG: IS630 family transposase [Candidatus Sungiibacteriota bacterium]